MVKPPKIFPSATLGVVCPSYHIDKEVYQRTSQIFIEKGFNIIEGKTINLKDNLYAGTPEKRAKDLMEMFQNPEVNAIVCARGGYGANRVLPLLDFDVIRNHPKIFVGFSDITALLISITQITGLVTFHGPMLVSYKEGLTEYNFKYFNDILSGKSLLKIVPPKELQPRILKSGKTTGELWGGNLCLLSNRIGTSGQLDTTDRILFIEDIDEQYYRFDRMMYHLKETGMFENIRGLIVGELINMGDTYPSFGKTTDEIVMDVCGDLDIPIITNFPCGHGKYQATLPISIPVELNADDSDCYLTILESAVR